MPSARILRDAIEQLSGTRYLITTKDNFAPLAVARYGGSARTTTPEGETANNSIDLIHLLSNKRTFSQLLVENEIGTVTFNNVSTPPSANEFPVLVRETLSSYGGRGIHVCHNTEEFNSAARPGYFWTKFLRFSNEYRVHVAGGQVLRVFEKVRTEGLETEEFPIRNSDRGYHFSLRNRPLHGQAIRSIVTQIAAIPQLSTGFYALDLGWVRAENRAGSQFSMHVIEGNSAPGLNEETAMCYARYILGMPQVQAQAQVEAQPQVQEGVPVEVLRSNTNPARAGEPNPVAPARQQQQPPARRAEWVR